MNLGRFSRNIYSQYCPKVKTADSISIFCLERILSKETEVIFYPIKIKPASSIKYNVSQMFFRSSKTTVASIY